MYLVDTNIFLEILLGQDKKELCKKFLIDHSDFLFISDFSLHSIGVILLKMQKSSTFETFLNKFLPDVSLLSCPKENYRQVIVNSQNFQLDFDDAYQLTLAQFFGFSIVSLDKHFKKIKAVQTVIL